MKTCPKCGYINNETASFCLNCGTALDGSGESFAPAVAYKVPSGAEQGLLKKLTGSGLGLAIALLVTLALILNVAGVAYMPYTLSNSLDEVFGLIEQYGLDDYVSPYVDYDSIQGQIYSLLSGANPAKQAITSLSTNVTGILLIASFWIIWATAKSKKTPCCSSAGFTIIQVLKILGLIGVSLAALIVLGALGGFAVYYGKQNSGAAVILGIVFGVAALIFTLVIIYFAGMLKILTRLRCVAENAPPKGKISGYVIFFKRFGAVLTALSGIAMLFRGLNSGYAMLILAAATLCDAAGNFCIASLLSKCRDELRA